MGAYVNPVGESKEEWLMKNGHLLTGGQDFMWESLPKGFLFVCLIDNGHFTAAGIAYSKEEFERFKRDNSRPKSWYIAEIQKLHEVSSNLLDYLASL